MPPKQKFRRQIYYLTADQFAARLEKLYGEGSQSRFSEDTGLSRSIVSRYCGAKVRKHRPAGQWIPRDVVLMLMLIEQAQKHGLEIPKPKPRDLAA